MLLMCVGGLDILRQKYNQENRIYLIFEVYRFFILYVKLYFVNIYNVLC